jgi:hypothetical protein
MQNFRFKFNLCGEKKKWQTWIESKLQQLELFEIAIKLKFYLENLMNKVNYSENTVYFSPPTTRFFHDCISFWKLRNIPTY